ncbi:MAG: hypothetical protein H6684_04290 [Deltaproteobacteria bacterium]|nr:hypothetical protein [Deltaproteobacteria bacterium]
MQKRWWIGAMAAALLMAASPAWADYADDDWEDRWYYCTADHANNSTQANELLTRNLDPDSDDYDDDYYDDDYYDDDYYDDDDDFDGEQRDPVYSLSYAQQIDEGVQLTIYVSDTTRLFSLWRIDAGHVVNLIPTQSAKDYIGEYYTGVAPFTYTDKCVPSGDLFYVLVEYAGPPTSNCDDDTADDDTSDDDTSDDDTSDDDTTDDDTEECVAEGDTDIEDSEPVNIGYHEVDIQVEGTDDECGTVPITGKCPASSSGGSYYEDDDDNGGCGCECPEHRPPGSGMKSGLGEGLLALAMLSIGAAALRRSRRR